MARLDIFETMADAAKLSKMSSLEIFELNTPSKKINTDCQMSNGCIGRIVSINDSGIK